MGGWGWVDNESSPHRIMDALCKTLPTKHQSRRSGRAPIFANGISHPIFGFLSGFLKEVRTTSDATSDTGIPSVRSSTRRTRFYQWQAGLSHGMCMTMALLSSLNYDYSS